MRNHITSSRDLELKLYGTVCRYKGVPVYIGQTSAKLLHLYDITRKESVASISPNDPDFDTATPQLGYMNYEDQVYYVSRPPLRRTRQGIDTRNTVFKPLVGRFNYPPEHLLYSVQFRDMVMGNYPKLDSVLENMRASWKKDYNIGLQKAVTRHIALMIKGSGIIDVWYKEQNIGYILPSKPDTVVVPDREDAWVISRYLSHELSWKVD